MELQGGSEGGRGKGREPDGGEESRLRRGEKGERKTLKGRSLHEEILFGSFINEYFVKTQLHKQVWLHVKEACTYRTFGSL